MCMAVRASRWGNEVSELVDLVIYNIYSIGLYFPATRIKHKINFS